MTKAMKQELLNASPNNEIFLVMVDGNIVLKSELSIVARNATYNCKAKGEPAKCVRLCGWSGKPTLRTIIQ